MKRQPADGVARHIARRHKGTGNQPAMPRMDISNHPEAGSDDGLQRISTAC